MLCPAWLGLPWAPERKALGCAPHLGMAGERRDPVWVWGSQRGPRGAVLPPYMAQQGTAEGIACHGREVWCGLVCRDLHPVGEG